MKSNEKGFSRYISQKKQAKEIISSLINEMGELATTDKEKAELLSEFVALVFIGSQDSPVTHIPKLHIPKSLCEIWVRKITGTVREQV